MDEADGKLPPAAVALPPPTNFATRMVAEEKEEYSEHEKKACWE